MRVKRLLIGGVLLLISLVALSAAILFSGAISGEQIKPYIVSGARDYAGYDLEIAGDINYKLLPAPHVQVADVSVMRGNSLSDKAAFQATLKQMDLYISLVDLVKGQFVIDSLKLISPVVKMKDAQAWRTDKIDEMMAAKKSVKAPSASSAAFQKVRNFEIDDGSFSYGAEGQQQTLSGLSLKLAYNLLLNRYDAQLGFAYKDNPVKANIHLNLQDLAQKIVGIEGQIELEKLKSDLKLAGILSWDNGLSYQGEFNSSTELPYKLLAKVTDNSIKLSSLLSVSMAENGQGYVVKASNSELNYDQYKYALDLNGTLLGTDTADLNMKFASDLDADIILEDHLERLIGNFESKNTLKIARDGDVRFTSDVDVLDHKFALKFANAKNSVPKITLNGERLKFSEFYKKREVVETKEASPLDLYFVEGQDYVHDKIISYLKLIPNLPTSHWTVSLGDVEYDKQKLDDLSLDFVVTDKHSVEIKRFGASYLGQNKFGLSGHIVGGTEKPSYDLNFAIDVKKPSDIYAFLPKYKTSFLLNFAGDTQKYNWDGDAKIKGDTLNFKALHKEQLPKDHVSLLILDMDFKKFSNLTELAAFQQVVGDFKLGGAAKLNAQIGILKDKSVQLDHIKGTIGGSKIDISGHSRFIGQKPDVSLKFTADKLSYTPKAKPKTKVAAGDKGKWSRNEIKLPLPSDVKAAADVTIGELRVNGDRYRDVKADVLVQGQAVQVNNFSAAGFGGKVVLKGAYKDNQKRDANIDINVSNVKAEQLYRSFVSSKKAPLIEGGVNLDVNAQSFGRSSSALIYSLSGQGKLSGDKIILNGMDIKKVGDVLRLDTKLEKNLRALDDVMNSALKKGRTAFDSVNVPYKIDGGVIKISNGILSAPDFDLKITGDVSLVDNTLNLQNTIRYKGEGEVDLPEVQFTVKGSLNAPVKDITTQIVQEFLKSKLERKLNKTLNSVLQDLLPSNGAPEQSGDDAANDNAPTRQEIIDPAQLLIKQILGQ